MMAEKAALFDDQENRAQVLRAPTPNAAKALGRKVRGFNDKVWLQHRYDIVVRANQAKFSQNPQLNEYLLQTGSRVIVEASPVDNVWGIGLAQDSADANNPNLWKGLNLLGFALMQVRDGTGRVSQPQGSDLALLAEMQKPWRTPGRVACGLIKIARQSTKADSPEFTWIASSVCFWPRVCINAYGLAVTVTHPVRRHLHPRASQLTPLAIPVLQ